MTDVYLLLGTNIGKRKENIFLAEQEIGKSMGRIITKSSVYESPSWGYDSENSFLNRTISIKTSKEPVELLAIIKVIESSMGRIKKSKQYEDRLIDIDILFYGNERITAKELIIPHPSLHLRRFTLVPLSEIAGEFVHPVMHKTIIQLLADCGDNSKLEKFPI